MFSHTSQPCTFERDCEVAMIPLGDVVTIPAGTVGYITQSLGGSFSVFVDGNLFRVAGVDADAIGKQPVMPPSLPADATEEDVERLLWDQMKTVYDPEIPVNIVRVKCRWTAKTAKGWSRRDPSPPGRMGAFGERQAMDGATISGCGSPSIRGGTSMMSEVARLETNVLVSCLSSSISAQPPGFWQGAVREQWSFH
jgi:hypothetical protein